MTLLVDHDTVLVTVLSQLTPSHFSWLEREDMRMLIAVHLNSHLQRCLISGRPSSPVNISGNFTPRKFTVTLQLSKQEMAPGPDSISPELILDAKGALKSWLYGFLSSCLRRLKIPKIWRRAMVAAI